MAVVDAVIDSNILIDHLNGIPSAELTMDRYVHPAISIITWMELLVGVKPDTEAVTRLLLEQFELLQITADIAEAAVVCRRDRKLKLADAVILATAQVLGCVLVTRNTRDFDRNAPYIEVPYDL